jgi:hypothetical protein
MERTTEIPDAHVANLAQQFLDTAILLRNHIPAVVVPSALRVNAAFAIELFLKSLNSHWKNHKLVDFDDAYEITTGSNVRGHRLETLFDHLPEPIGQELSTSFAKHALARNFTSLREILALYGCTFEIERYRFEQQAIATDNRRIDEIVDLAQFVGSYVRDKPRTRYAIT